MVFILYFFKRCLNCVIGEISYNVFIENDKLWMIKNGKLNIKYIIWYVYFKCKYFVFNVLIYCKIDYV